LLHGHHHEVHHVPGLLEGVGTLSKLGAQGIITSAARALHATQEAIQCHTSQNKFLKKAF